MIKFIYPEKATKFSEISTLFLSVCTVDNSEVEISQDFVAFSEYTNFNNLNATPENGLNPRTRFEAT